MKKDDDPLRPIHIEKKIEQSILQQKCASHWLAQVIKDIEVL